MPQPLVVFTVRVAVGLRSTSFFSRGTASVSSVPFWRVVLHFRSLAPFNNQHSILLTTKNSAHKNRFRQLGSLIWKFKLFAFFYPSTSLQANGLKQKTKTFCVLIFYRSTSSPPLLSRLRQVEVNYTHRHHQPHHRHTKIVARKPSLF